MLRMPGRRLHLRLPGALAAWPLAFCHRRGFEPVANERELRPSLANKLCDIRSSVGRVRGGAGVRAGRIVTTLADDRERPAGRPRRNDSHYVYGRADLPCRICGTPVLDAQIAARRLFWCPVCQA